MNTPEIDLGPLWSGEDLSAEQCEHFFHAMAQGAVSEPVLAAFLMAMKFKRPTADEIAGAARALREAATHLPQPESGWADNCGTGGDGSNSFNISTASAVVAATCGVTMAKHGNRSVSSRCGSADVLETLGVAIEATPETARACIDQAGIGFLFAPRYHPGFRHAVPVRKALKTRTLFNILGPLLNPARPDYQLIGVFDPKYCALIAESLAKIGLRRGMVVHGSGTDEIALHGETQAVVMEAGETRPLQINPTAFGLRTAPLEALHSEGPEQSKRILLDLFTGHGPEPHRAVVALNAGAVIWLAGQEETLAAGVGRAMEILGTDRCALTLNKWIEVSNDPR